ncbi:arginyl-tRNA synthetase [Salmonella enterica subsp. enterica]|nr:arginyl-tRNA synthetase [Salmonella enterica subsp. enterica]
MNIQALLSEKVSQAMIAAGAPADCEPQVRQSAKVQFGDYQANGMMAVAKKLGMAPRQLAEQVLTHLDLSGIASKVEIAGPGFINIFLEPAFLAEQVQQALASDRLGVSQPTRQTIVVDYSAAQRRERDARWSSTLHDYRRCGSAHAGVSGPSCYSR